MGRSFFLAVFATAVVLSGCASGKGEAVQPVKSTPVAATVKDTLQEKQKQVEESAAKGNLFREGWSKLQAGMTVGELSQLFGSDLGLGYCNRPNACQWSPKLGYYGFPEIKADVTFKFEGGKLTDWSPKSLP